VPSAAPVLMAPSGAETTPELCAPTTPDGCPPGKLNLTVERVEVGLPPMPPTAGVVLVAPAPVVPVAPPLPTVLFNEILIVQEVAAPLASNWQTTG
jgi:hypothetical protein